jgi:hypothetical protein
MPSPRRSACRTCLGADLSVRRVLTAKIPIVGARPQAGALLRVGAFR